jgi:ribosomal protein L40E
MDDEYRRHLEGLLRTYQRRLRPLEQQAATFGPRTPPEVLMEIDDVRAEVARLTEELRANFDRVDLEQLWDRALTAFFTQDWDVAVKLLLQVRAIDSMFEDVQLRLVEARRQRRLQTFYRQICRLRDTDEWQGVLNALDELEQKCPGYPDSAGLRSWAVRRRREAQIKQCEACGADNPVNLAFCRRCGARIT